MGRGVLDDLRRSFEVLKIIQTSLKIVFKNIKFIAEVVKSKT